jgi:hypothetical protein
MSVQTLRAKTHTKTHGVTFQNTVNLGKNDKYLPLTQELKIAKCHSRILLAGIVLIISNVGVILELATLFSRYINVRQ